MFKHWWRTNSASTCLRSAYAIDHVRRNLVQVQVHRYQAHSRSIFFTFTYTKLLLGFTVSYCHKLQQLLYFSKFNPFIHPIFNMAESCCAAHNVVSEHGCYPVLASKKHHKPEILAYHAPFWKTPGSLLSMPPGLPSFSAQLKSLPSYFILRFTWATQRNCGCLISFLSEQTYVLYGLKTALTKALFCLSTLEVKKWVGNRSNSFLKWSFAPSFCSCKQIFEWC